MNRIVKVWHTNEAKAFNFLFQIDAIDEPSGDTHIILNDEQLDTATTLLIEYKEKPLEEQEEVKLPEPVPIKRTRKRKTE